MVLQRTGDSEKPAHRGILNGPGSSGLNACSYLLSVGSDGNPDRKNGEGISLFRSNGFVPLMSGFHIEAGFKRLVDLKTGGTAEVKLSSHEDESFIF